VLPCRVNTPRSPDQHGQGTHGAEASTLPTRERLPEAVIGVDRGRGSAWLVWYSKFDVKRLRRERAVLSISCRRHAR
jgi:hypothetical protein